MFEANYSNLENYAFDASYSNLENYAFDANYSNLENYAFVDSQLTKLNPPIGRVERSKELAMEVTSKKL